MSRYHLGEALRGPTDLDQLLRATTPGRAVGVDRSANVLRGYVVAQVGPFKSEGRGEFDRLSLDQIVQLGNAATRGLRAHFAHESLCSDALGSFLGRSRGFRIDNTLNAAGQRVEAVRADLHFDRTALLPSPKGGGRPLGLYVMDLAESDPEAISSSLVLAVKREHRLKADGTKQKGPNGEELPPLWRPYRLTASDIVSQGDAVDGILSVGGLRDEHLWQAEAILGRLLDAGHLGESRREVRDRLVGWLDRALDARFGPQETASSPRPTMIQIRQRMRELEAGVY